MSKSLIFSFVDGNAVQGQAAGEELAQGEFAEFTEFDDGLAMADGEGPLVGDLGAFAGIEGLEGLEGFDYSRGIQSVTAQKILLVGAGGCGGNIVNAVADVSPTGVTTLAVNTDLQHLAAMKTDARCLIGQKLCRGLGAGNVAARGAQAALESRDAIEKSMEPHDLIVVVAGMGGGTGTGAAPVIAKIARDMGKLVLALVTLPFHDEGPRKKVEAERGLKHVMNHADATILIPNQRLFSAGVEARTAAEAYRAVNRVLVDAACAISDIINRSGLQNVDFADVTRTLQNGGLSVFGTSSEVIDENDTEADFAYQAGAAAVSNPLYDCVDLPRAKRILVNCTFDYNRVELQAMRRVLEAVRGSDLGEDVEVIYGHVQADGSDEFVVTVIASHIDEHPNPVRPTEAFESDVVADFLSVSPAAAAPSREPTASHRRIDAVRDAPSEMDGFATGYGTGRNRIQRPASPSITRRTHGPGDGER